MTTGTKEKKALVCKCGECARWELVEHEREVKFDTPIPIKMRCITCGREFDATLSVPAHDHLLFVALKTAEKSTQAKV
jgi:hypothetical protein